MERHLTKIADGLTALTFAVASSRETGTLPGPRSPVCTGVGEEWPRSPERCVLSPALEVDERLARVAVEPCVKSTDFSGVRTLRSAR